MRAEIIRVKDVMRQHFDIVQGRDTVRQALDKMKNVETHVLVVDKRHDDDEYGVVMLADIAKKVLAKDRSPDRVNIYEIMSKPALHVLANMDIRYCARLFHRFGLNSAPVMEHDNVVGIISYSDMIIRGIMKMKEMKCK